MTIGEPALAITKAMTPDSDLEAGDLVTITLTVTNSGPVPAFDVVATDVLNDGTDNDLFALAAAGINDTSTGTGADDFAFAYVEGTGTVTYTAQGGVSLAANGGQVIFTFTATVGPDIRTGWTYTNEASAVGNSQDGGTNGRETPEVESNTATVSTGVGAVSKVIDASSEPWTTESAGRHRRGRHLSVELQHPGRRDRQPGGHGHLRRHPPGRPAAPDRHGDHRGLRRRRDHRRRHPGHRRRRWRGAAEPERHRDHADR